MNNNFKVFHEYRMNQTTMPKSNTKEKILMATFAKPQQVHALQNTDHV